MTDFTPSSAELSLVTQIFAKADPQKLSLLADDSDPFSSGSYTTRTAPQKTEPCALQAQTNGLKGPPFTLSTRPTAVIQAPNAFGNARPFYISQPAWDITAAEKASADMLFDTLDPLKKNHIEGDAAVPLMQQSNLPVETLAQVWDLADMNQDGKLTRDGFAIAMHLIQGKLAGKDIPESLPQSLVPPSMRANATTPFISSPPQDPMNLLWNGTAASFGSIELTQKQSPPPMISSFTCQTTLHKPATFSGSSSSGDFFNNELAASSAPLYDQVQLNSVDISLSTVKAVCETLKQALATQTGQLTSLQDQLSSANASNETGAQLLTVLRNRMDAQMSETRKARDELRRAQNDLIAMRIEKAETATLRAEVADLKFQNSRLTSENKRLETKMAQMDCIRNTDALGGSSSITFQRFHQSPASPPYALTHGHTDHPPNQHHSDFELAALMQQEFDDEHLREELLKDTPCSFECAVCMDEQPEDYVTLLDLCGHKFCRECIRSHIGTKLAEHCFPILCPVCMTEGDKSDPGIITSAVVEQAGITEQQYETWLELEIAEFSVPLHCRECDRSFSVDRQDLEDTDTISCPLQECYHVWCKLCQQSISQDGPEHSCDGLAELDHLMKQRGWKYCPNCKTPIEKGMGCNHMTCISPGCNTHFCYICGDSIIRSALPNDINAATNAHFQRCNIFEDVADED